GSLKIVASRGEEALTYAAKAVVNCAGPWLRRFAALPPTKLQVGGWCRAMNLVLRRSLDERFAIGVPSIEGRLLFMVPRDGTTAVGTWYSDFKPEYDDKSVSDQEVDSALSEINQTFPGLKLTSGDVLKVDQGVLPSYGVGEKGPQLVGSEKIGGVRNKRGDAQYLEVLSTKYTTFLEQGRAVVKKLNLPKNSAAHSKLNTDPWPC
ncbi:MAG: FAD-dependent oxidoreductase, partial [Bdellovibrionales bacterium]|nr:FAD-dependent oxidoreductase [Bdellovibrionales bacterium]